MTENKRSFFGRGRPKFVESSAVVEVEALKNAARAVNASQRQCDDALSVAMMAGVPTRVLVEHTGMSAATIDRRRAEVRRGRNPQSADRRLIVHLGPGAGRAAAAAEDAAATHSVLLHGDGTAGHTAAVAEWFAECNPTGGDLNKNATAWVMDGLTLTLASRMLLRRVSRVDPEATEELTVVLEGELVGLFGALPGEQGPDSVVEALSDRLRDEMSRTMRVGSGPYRRLPEFAITTVWHRDPEQEGSLSEDQDVDRRVQVLSLTRDQLTGFVDDIR